MVDVDLSATIDGITCPNPLIIASGPSALNYKAIMKCFERGAGGVVTKTITFDPMQQLQPKPRMYVLGKKDLFAGRFYSFYSVDLMSEYSPEKWVKFLRNIKRDLKRRGMNGVLIASIAGRSYEEWGKLASVISNTGVDAIELNLSCPHIERGELMGRAVASNPEAVKKIVKIVKKNSISPVIGKLTPHGANPLELAKMAASAGIDALVSTARFQGLVIDAENLGVVSWGGYGGYGGPWQLPISLSWTAKIVNENLGVPVIGSGGISSGTDIAKFILVGADATQCCTTIMLRGREFIPKMITELKEWMDRHGFTRISDFRGYLIGRMTDVKNLNRRRIYRFFVTKKCSGCGICVEICPYEAIQLDSNRRAKISMKKCDNCGLCHSICPSDAIEFKRLPM